MSVELSAKVCGRTISSTIRIRLIPPTIPGDSQTLGHTDAACEIGVGLIREMARLLVAAAEQEGFQVELDYMQTVY